MNQKKFFGRSLTFLIVAVLFITAFIRGPVQVWWYAGAFTVWGIALLARFATSKAVFIKKAVKKRRKKAQPVILPPNTFEIPEIFDPTGTVLLRHVNHRISAYLKPKYPSVTWEWVSKNPDRIAAEGGTGKIKLFDVPDFNYAEIELDQMAHVGCNLMKIVPLADLQNADGSNGAANPLPGQPDPEAWYNIQGKSVLETCVADLHSRGIASLFIKENGDVCVQQNNQEVVQNKLKNFPVKSVWQGLVKVITDAGLTASITNNVIKVSW